MKGLGWINLHIYLNADKWVVFLLLISVIIFISSLSHILNLSQARLLDCREELTEELIFTI